MCCPDNNWDSLSVSSRTNSKQDQHNQSPVSDILFLSEITMFTQAVIQVEIKLAAGEQSRWPLPGVLMNISSISVCPAVRCRCLHVLTNSFSSPSAEIVDMINIELLDFISASRQLVEVSRCCCIPWRDASVDCLAHSRRCWMFSSFPARDGWCVLVSNKGPRVLPALASH